MAEKKRKVQKFNKSLIGTGIGLVLPLIPVLIFYFVRGGENKGVLEYIEHLKAMGTLLPIFSVATLINLIPFYVGKYFGLWYANRGVVFSIFVYVLIVVIMKFS